jgi:hypothetical protein
MLPSVGGATGALPRKVFGDRSADDRQPSMEEVLPSTIGGRWCCKVQVMVQLAVNNDAANRSLDVIDDVVSKVSLYTSFVRLVGGAVVLGCRRVSPC